MTEQDFREIINYMAFWCSQVKLLSGVREFYLNSTVQDKHLVKTYNAQAETTNLLADSIAKRLKQLHTDDSEVLEALHDYLLYLDPECEGIKQYQTTATINELEAKIKHRKEQLRNE